MMWMDVDAALTEVPVNLIPLVDAATAKVIDEGVTYDEAGMDLIWHFETTAGVNTATPVTPTTGGDYDWAHTDGGMYTIEIPDTGGASANNDTEGFGYFTGNTTANLPWRGPTIGFRAAGLNDKLIDSAYSATLGLAGTALPAFVADGAGGLPVSDAGNLDLDTLLGYLTGNVSTAAKLLAYVQLMLREDYAISQDNSTEVTAINADGGSGGGAFLNTTDSQEATRDRGDLAWLTGGSGGATKSYTTTDWTRTVGDDDGGVGSDTLTVNGVYYATGEINSTTLLEVDAVFTATVTETAQSLDFWGFYAGGGSHIINVQAYDTTGSVYEPIGTIGLGTEVEKHTFPLSPSHTDPSTGVVTIKFIHSSGTGITSHVFNVDKAQVNTSVPSTTAEKMLAYVQLLARSDSAIETDRSTELGEINTDEGTGAGDYSAQTDSQEQLADLLGNGSYGLAKLVRSTTPANTLDIANGAAEADLTYIHGTALTETAGQLAGSFVKFFNVATPTGTVDSIPDAVAGDSGGLLIAGSNAATTYAALTVSGTTTLTGAISAPGGITVDITGDLSGSVGTVNALANNVITTLSIADAALTTPKFTGDLFTSALFADDCFLAVNFASDVSIEFADALLVRDLDQVEGSAPDDSICGAALASLHWETVGNSLVVYKTDDETVFMTIPIESDPDAEGVTRAN